MVNYRQLYNTKASFMNYLSTVKKWGGQTQTVNAGGTKRGWAFCVSYLPLPIVRDLFILVM